MKYSRRICLAILAIGICSAFGSSGIASGTVLCGNNSSTTSCSSKFAAGTEIKWTWNAQVTWHTTGGTTLATCTGGQVTGKTSNSGSSTETVKGPLSSLTWTGCTKEIKTLTNGEFEIHSISGTDNGTLTLKNTQYTINGLFENESCIYGAGTGTDVGTIVGGSPATGSVSSLVPRQTGSGFLCPAEIRWTGAFVITASGSFFVANG
jgi:hypothetical protein